MATLTAMHLGAGNFSLGSPSRDMLWSGGASQLPDTPTPQHRIHQHSKNPPIYPPPPPASLPYRPFSTSSAPPRPQKMSTARRAVDSAPRTPDRAAVQNGAFADMPNNNTPLPPTPFHLSPRAAFQMGQTIKDYAFTVKIDEIFTKAEKYAWSHMNYPSTSGDSNLTPSIKERLMKAATRETAHSISATGMTRYFLMTKIIIEWIIKHLFTPYLYKSFDLAADLRIFSLRDNIYQDTPPLVKYQMLFELSKEIQQIRERPTFSLFLNTLVTNQCAKLWSILSPLMHVRTNMDRSDLAILMYEAYDLAGDMAAAPLEWRFEFAEIGSDYHTSMINRDPYIKEQEDDLATRGLVVKLGVLPAVYLRDSPDGVVRVQLLKRPHVLLKEIS